MGAESQTERGLRNWGTGVVAKDKDPNSDYIEVWPSEDFSLALGRLQDQTNETKNDLPDSRGVVKKSTATGKKTVKARWIPEALSNRDSSPDVYEGESVKLIRYGDTQEVYWTTLFREPSIRRLERVRYSFSNKSSKDGKAYDDDSSYWVEFDTRNKQVKVHTSSNDGEATAYDLTLNTKDGLFEFKDELGNSITLDSPKGIFEMIIENKIIQRTKVIEMEATESFSLKTPEGTTTGDKWSTKAPEILQDGCMTLTDGMKASTKSGSGETIEIDGDLKVKGNIAATGTIIDGGGNTPNHTH